MDNYNVIRQIGKGAFSNVHLCREEKTKSSSLLLSKYMGIFGECDTELSDLFIIKEINIDNLVRKYTNKSRANILSRINSSNDLVSLPNQSLNITPYSTKPTVFNREVMKKLDTEEEYYYKRLKDLIDSEIEILKRLNHHNIIRYFSSNIDTSDGNQIYCIKMEYCIYGDLYTILKKQSKDKSILCNFKLRNRFGGFEDIFIKKFLKDTTSGLKYLHGLNIIHRDIKLHNVLIKKENVGNNFLFKLSDFGFSCFDIDTKLNESLNVSDLDFSTSSLKKKYYKLCGTPYYMAPEIILNIEEFDQISSPEKINDIKTVKFYDKNIDLWSYGICLYELIFNNLPFSGISDIHDLRDFFSKPTTQLYLNKEIDKKCIIDQKMKDILKMLLTINPSFRITSDKLYKIIDGSLKSDSIYIHDSIVNIEHDYNIINPDSGTKPLFTNVVYEPIDINSPQASSSRMFLDSWDKINKASSLITKISVDTNFMKWLLNK